MIKLYKNNFLAKAQRRNDFKLSLRLCAFASILLFSCNKPDDPDPTDTTPVFFINGKLDNADIAISAGKNNYYMFSSYTLDSNDVFNFSGELKKTDCNAAVCTNSLRIRFNNYKADATPSSAIDAGSFPLTYLPYAIPGGAPASYSVKFTPLTTGGQPQSFLWDFGDGATSTEGSPTHIYANTGIYEVGLTVSYQSGCSSNISNPLNLGVSALSCDAGFILSSVNVNTVTLTSNPGGTGPWIYDWDFGDGTPHDNTANPTHTFANPGVYQVCLTTVSSDSCTNTRCLNVATENPGECSIRYSSTISTISNPYNFSTVVVEWTNAAGVQYTSNHATQPTSSYFKINSVEEYETNENGAKTKKLNLSLSCTLYNGSNNINLTNAEAVIAVAYP